MGKAVKEILLCHHFVPVPIHLLPKVGVLTLFQLDQRCDLSIECIFCEVLNLLLKAREKFFYLLVNSFGAETIWVEAKGIQPPSA